MKYVYILQSLSTPSEHYVGITHNLKERLAAHNSGKCIHTSKHAPWKIITATYFADEDKAAAFERYLKSGSGRAFSSRHFR
jgi:putative endonuclease